MPAAGRTSRCSAALNGALLRSFMAYAINFTGGVRVAAGDVNGDRFADIVTAAGAGGGPHIQVFDGTNVSHVLQSFMAYDTKFTGGVYVAAADLNGDGKADIVTGAGAGGGPHVEVFSGANRTVLASFFAYDSNFRGGVRVGIVHDVDGDGLPDIITAPGPAADRTPKSSAARTDRCSRAFTRSIRGSLAGSLWRGS